MLKNGRSFWEFKISQMICGIKLRIDLRIELIVLE